MQKERVKQLLRLTEEVLKSMILHLEAVEDTSRPGRLKRRPGRISHVNQGVFRYYFFIIKS